MSITYFVGIAISCCETFKYEQFHFWRKTISWCSGIAFSGFQTFKYGQCCPAMRSISYFSKIAFSGCETFKYEQCHSARRSICWFSGIAFSVCETFKYVLSSPVICWFGDSQKSLFQAAERWDILIAFLEEGHFADAQEFRCQAANISNTGIAVLQDGRLATSQILCFRLWNFEICAVTCCKSTTYWLWGFVSSVLKRLDIWSDDMKRLRFADAWESRFLDWK